jgi:hypothetical protein
MESIFGKFYTNKNLAIELSRFLTVDVLIKMVRVSKKFNIVYTQDIIWWMFLHNNLSDLR